MTKPTEMSLDELGKTLRASGWLHLNMGSEGHYKQTKILDPSGREIGDKCSRTIKGKTTTTWFLGDQEFSTGERFLKAYQQQLRDEEFEASSPKGKGNE